jgi:hypothetical protein
MKAEISATFADMECVSGKTSHLFTRTTNWANTKTESVDSNIKMAHIPIAQTIAKGLREAGEAHSQTTQA